MSDHARATAIGTIALLAVYELLGDWIWRAVLAWLE